jgi:DNA-binding protein H-NS
MANDLKASLETLSADELFLLHMDVARELKKRLEAKKNLLDEQLRRLHPTVGDAGTVSRRPYPPVAAKFRNPDRPSESWSGRGRRPRWLDAQLRSGKQIDDFRIDGAA